VFSVMHDGAGHHRAKITPPMRLLPRFDLLRAIE
jgi:hypothetical protein